jgi:hypothetical protein
MQISMQVGRVDALAPLRSRARRSCGVRASAARAGASPVTWGNRLCHAGAHLSKERKAELEKVCEHIAQRGKGITACDEGPGACARAGESAPRPCAGWSARLPQPRRARLL